MPALRNMTISIVADTNILWGDTGRDILRELHQCGFITLYWGAWLTRELGIELTPETCVESSAPLLGLPDPTDEPIAGCVLASRATILLTNNKRDFPQHLLPGISIMTLDEFLVAHANQPQVKNTLEVLRTKYKLSVEDFTARLNRARLHKFSSLN